MSVGIQLKPSEMSRAFDLDAARREYSAILSPEQVAGMLGYSRSTVYDWIKKGRFDGAYRKRGKHARFWRDRVLDIFFNGPEWNQSP
jgi:excisionase family DNA binding protein